MTEKKITNDSAAEKQQAPSGAKAQPTKAAKDTAPKAPKPAPQQKSGGSKTGLIAIALVIALGGGLYYHGHQQSLAQEAQITALQNQLSGLKNSLASNEQSVLSKVNTTLTSTEVALNQQEKSISSLQMALAEMKGRSPNDWLLAGADYLTKMAGRKLWLEHDVNSATVLLEAADHRIAELNDPSLKDLRLALNNDITSLKAVARVDRDGLVLRLTSLEQHVDSLPLANALMPKALEQKAQTVSQSVNDWKANLMTSLENFSDHFITYRKRDGNVVPLLSPQQDFYLQENIKNKLETAIRAVYREQGEVYKQSLITAQKWAEQYYDMSSPAVQSFVKTLEQLENQNIEAVYPKQLKAQAILTNIISERLRSQVKSLATEESKAEAVKPAVPEVKAAPKTEAKVETEVKTEATETQSAPQVVSQENQA